MTTLDDTRLHDTAPDDATDAAPLPRLDGVAFRPFDPDRDYAPLAEIISTANRIDEEDWAPSETSLRHDWSHDAGMDPTRDAIVAERDGAMVGGAAVGWRERDGLIIHWLTLIVRHEDRRRGIGSALLAWIEAHARETVEDGRGGPTDKGHEFTGWSRLGRPGAPEFAAARGYTPIRYFNLMRRDLSVPIPELPMPDGLEVRPVVEADHRRIWDADVEAFQDHFGAGPATEEDFVSHFTHPDVDTSIWQVAWDGDEVAGSVMNTVYVDENTTLGVDRGWLDHVSVRRPWRKRGLASALIARSLVVLRERGVAEAVLGVDSENPTGALGVYERLGFERIKTSAVFRKPF